MNHSLRHATVQQTNSNHTAPFGEVEFVRVASRLSISPVSEEDIGQYWCKVLSSNGTVLAARSNVLTLEREEAYNSFAPCVDTNSIIRRDCATLNEPTTAPVLTTTVQEVAQINSTTTEPMLISTISAQNATTTWSNNTDSPVTEEEESNIPAIIVYSVPTTILVLCILATILIFVTILLRLKHQHCKDIDESLESSSSPHYEVIDVDDIVAKTTAVKQTQLPPPSGTESYDDIVPPPILLRHKQGKPGFAITNNVAYYLDPRLPKTLP